jgi:hypothetical protein
VVEHHHQGGGGLADRLPRLPVRVQPSDEVGDLLRLDLVDVAVAEKWQRPVEGGAVVNRGRLGDVDARLLPPLGRLRERRLRRRLMQLCQVGYAKGGEAPPQLARTSFLVPHERLRSVAHLPPSTPPGGDASASESQGQPPALGDGLVGSD